MIASRRVHGLARAGLVAALAVAGCIEAEDRGQWDYVHGAIVQPNCATSGCHTSLGASPIGPSQSGLQLEDREGAYFVLVGAPCEGEVPPELVPPDGNFVEPGDPEASRVIRMLRGLETITMPPDAPLPEGEIQAFEEWIRRGALCD